MRQGKKILYSIYVVLSLIILTGCPSVQFYVEPETVTFGEVSTRESIRIVFNRRGNWEWEAETKNDWLKLSKDGGVTTGTTISGKLSSEKVRFIDLIADRSLLPEGTSVGEVYVKSSGSTKVVRVSITKPAVLQLSVNPTELNFGPVLTELQVSLMNQSRISSSWSVSIPNDATWLTVVPKTGEISANGDVVLTFRVNRSGLSVGVYQTTVKITADSQELQIPVSMEVSAIQVSPGEIQFGLISSVSQQDLSVTNLGTGDVSIRIQISEGSTNWLSVQTSEFTLSSNQKVVVPVVANPEGLVPNDYTGTLNVIDVASGFTLPVAVRMRIPALSVSPTDINFGKIRERQTSTFSITNLAPVSWRWTSAIPEDATWLRLSPANADIAAGETQTVTVEADPIAVRVGAYRGSVTISSNWGSAVVNVQMEASRAPKLVALPTLINFGELRSEEVLAIWNDGEDTIAWQIDTTSFPTWLSITPVNSQGIASGQVKGSQTDLLRVKVDRSLANEAEGPSYQHQFSITGNVVESSTASNAVLVQVSMSIPQIPAIVIEAEGLDSSGLPFINFAFEEIEQEFTIKNNGNGTLEWQIDSSQLPAWITGINPLQGSLAKGKEQKVKINISRDTLTYLGDVYELSIKSNDINNPNVKLLVEVQVPKMPKIGTLPKALNYGLREMLRTFDVANVGDPETILNFMLIPNKDWISVFPESGVSFGTSGQMKDWKTISVAIDREKLEGANASGQISVVATKIVDGNVEIDTSIEPAIVTITASAPALTPEMAPPNLRIPSLVRFVMTLRDVQQRAIQFPESFLPVLADKFLITEDDLSLDVTESNRFLIPFVKAERLIPHNGTILILLDASGSMLKSVQSMGETGISDADDPLREFYIRTVLPMIDEIPENYKIGLALFNEREWFDSSIRILINNDGEPLFTFNRDVAKNRLLNIDVIDHGATALLPAIASGALEIYLADGYHVPFDVSDDRIMLLITDGQLTTPPGEMSPVTDFLKMTRVRPLIIGWGEKINNNILFQLIEETGGHVYSTRNQDTGEVDSLGRPITKPLLSTLEDWLQTNPSDPCDRSIAEDIKSQILFEYIALNQKSGATITMNLSFNSPADDNSLCLPDQGEISTTFSYSNVDLLTYANDVRLGQIKLISSGINSNAVDVVVYSDYMPRNITRLQFSVNTTGGNAGMTMSVSQPTPAQGGIISDWTFSQAGTIFTFSSPTNTPLPYGAFGPLCVLHFDNVTQEFNLEFNVIDPKISEHPDSKYFTHPNLFEIVNNPSFVTSNPYPKIVSDPAMGDGNEISLNRGGAITFYLYNIGGSHRPTNVGLKWDFKVAEGNYYEDIEIPDEKDRIIFENQTPFELMVALDENKVSKLKPGIYLSILEFSFNSIFNNPIVEYVYVYIYIEEEK